jgi:polysaccharide pyruvyl transferase WcaK-like protein
VLSSVDLITVRDLASREALVDLGVGQAAEVTADLAFLLPQPKDEEIAAAWRTAGLQRQVPPYAGVAVRAVPAAARNGDPHVGLAASIGRACADLGLKPVLIPMQPVQDLKFARLVASAMPCSADVVTRALSARESLAFLGGCDLVVAARLHALIYAGICGVPPVAVSYDPKVDALMERFSLPVAAALKSLDANALSDAIRDAWAARAGIRGVLAERIPGLRSAAMRNVQLALDLL